MRSLFAVFSAVVLFNGPVAMGHHSPSMFDQARHVTVSGLVTKFEWQNPHVYIYVDVQSDFGKAAAWIIEAQSPQVMSMFGWSTKSLAAGDRVTVVANPARDLDKNMALARSVLKQDGTLLRISWDRDEIRDAIRMRP